MDFLVTFVQLNKSFKYFLCPNLHFSNQLSINPRHIYYRLSPRFSAKDSMNYVCVLLSDSEINLKPCRSLNWRLSRHLLDLIMLLFVAVRSECIVHYNLDTNIPKSLCMYLNLSKFNHHKKQQTYSSTLPVSATSRTRTTPVIVFK